MNLAIEEASGLDPVAGDDARLLILGTFPGPLALKCGQYYPDRRNKFWEIMGRLFGASRDLDYEERLCRVIAKQIAIWDTIAACQRHGGSDSEIQWPSVKVNDFQVFLSKHIHIAVVCFNGKKAKQIWDDKVLFRTCPQTFAAGCAARSSPIRLGLTPI